jgi:hypothetical protein
MEGACASADKYNCTSNLIEKCLTPYQCSRARAGGGGTVAVCW